VGESLSGKKFVPFVMILFLVTLVTLINPYGIEYWKHMIHAISMPRPEINEWMSALAALKINFQVVPIVTFILLSTICLLFLIFYRRRYFTEMLIVAVISYLGYKHVRHTIFLGIVFGAFLPVILSELSNAYSIKRYFFNWLSWVSPILLAVFFLSTHWLIHKSISVYMVPSFDITASYSHYPIGALKWMGKNNFQGKVLPFFGWGEFLMWSCYPNCKVAMDGRYEAVYPENVYKEYFDFLMGREGWQIFLNKYPHDLVLIIPNTRIHLLMLKETSWKMAYSDSGCVLFIRKKHLNATKMKIGD